MHVWLGLDPRFLSIALLALFIRAGMNEVLLLNDVLRFFMMNMDSFFCGNPVCALHIISFFLINPTFKVLKYERLMFRLR